jgi:hypothetical protein
MFSSQFFNHLFKKLLGISVRSFENKVRRNIRGADWEIIKPKLILTGKEFKPKSKSKYPVKANLDQYSLENAADKPTRNHE